jgi:hypothetical protein
MTTATRSVTVVLDAARFSRHAAKVLRVTVHLDRVRVSSLGPDRVLVTGAEGSPPTPTTKVAIFGPIGYAVVNTIYGARRGGKDRAATSPIARKPA